ncbi:MAG: GxxExxY protein [Verrucomicrobia bacterium]|nr:GxxExxY protein [Verrucomicrobiota bacterium]
MVTENEYAAAVIEIAFQVHRATGPGLLESAYHRMLAFELEEAKIAFEKEVAVPIKYKSIVLESGFRADFIVDNSLLVEIKSVETIQPVHLKQVLTYVRLANLRLGLLINFGEEYLKNGIKRFANGIPDDSPAVGTTPPV